MLLRRITEHLKAQNWTAVGIDFVIVVVGVFIGIQVANWNDARQEKAREAHYVERLDAELEVIRTRLADARVVYERSAREIELLLTAQRDFAENGMASLPDDETLKRAVRNATTGRVPAGSPAAFKEMLSNGDLEILSSDELRQALFAYDEFANIARDGWRVLRADLRVSANVVGGYLDLLGPEDFDGLISVGGTRDIKVINFRKEAFFENPEIPAHLNILLRGQVSQFSLIDRQLKRVEQIENIIAKETK